MLDRTRAIFNKTLLDLKRFGYVLNVCTQLFYIAFLVYGIVVKTGGLRIANIVLCTASVLYFFFFMIATDWGKDIDATKQTKKVNSAFKWCKRLVKVYTLGVMIYGICATTGEVTPISVLFCAAMIALFIFTCIFDLLGWIVGRRVELFMAALEADVEPVARPVRNVGNFFKKIAGKEIEPEKEKTERDEKNLEVLDSLVEKEKEKRKQKEDNWKRKKKDMEDSEKQLLKQQKKAKKKKKKERLLPDMVEVEEEIAISSDK
ncbi:MAG: hypothetical protein IJX18_02710 [Clostridia bacterium]|nr:hypothetical protein [Clostridia bacterium]